MDYLDHDALHPSPSPSAHRPPHQPLRHGGFLQSAGARRRKTGGEDLVESENDDDQDDECYDEPDDEEEEVDDEDGEDEETAEAEGLHLLKGNQSSCSYIDRTRRVSNSLFGEPTPLSLSPADAARGLLKITEQEKQHRDDWNESATFALIQVWGAKYLQLGRRSLKLEDWTEVADQVSFLGKSLKTDIQCRNRIDTLKKKYKRETQKQAAIGSIDSKWAYYRHMDALLNTVPKRAGLPCTVDAGQIVRMNSRVWKDGKLQEDVPNNAKNASTSYEPRHNLEMSQSDPSMSDDDGDDRNQTSRKRKLNDTAFKSLAKAIKRFGEIYVKMENAKQQLLLDLEKTRLEFTRDLELQKMQLLMHAQMELAKMKQGNSDMDASVSNTSG